MENLQGGRRRFLGLFALSVFVINNAKTGKTFKAGKIDAEVFKKSIKWRT